MATYEIYRKSELTLKIEFTQRFLIPFNIEMHIHTLSFTNLRIINGYELPCFYDFQPPIQPVLFIDTNCLFFYFSSEI